MPSFDSYDPQTHVRDATSANSQTRLQLLRLGPKLKADDELA